MRIRTPLALVVVLALAAGCSGGGDQAAPTAAGPSSAAAASASPTPTPTPAVVVDGADAALTAAVAKVYAGKTGVEATATLGTWMKEKVAVVTSGDDVTLAVGPQWKVVGGWWPSLGKGTDLGRFPRFMLVMGSDARGSNLKGSRADTLQIIGLDGQGGAGIVGIPRDLYVPLSTGGTSKINAAFAYGGGPAEARTIENLSGIDVQGYVVTGFNGFGSIVDQSGGLPLVIEKAFTFLDLLKVKKGRQVADGGTALAYARERHAFPNGDFDRSRHQQEILIAGGVAARLAGPAILPKEMSIVSKYAQTDVDAETALTFLAAFYRIDPAKVKHTVVPGAIGTSSDGQSIVKVTPATRAVFAAFHDARL